MNKSFISKIYEYSKLATATYIYPEKKDRDVPVGNSDVLFAANYTTDPQFSQEFKDYRDDYIKYGGTKDADPAALQNRIPTDMGTNLFSAQAQNKNQPNGTWTIPVGGFHGNDASGFAATLYQNQLTGEKVLAVRGTEPGRQSNVDLSAADIGLSGKGIGFFGLAFDQAVGLINYVRQLCAPEGTDV